MEIFTKQPQDIIEVAVDYSEWLAADDNIVLSVSAITVPQDGALVLPGFTINTATKTVKQKVSAGTSGKTYQASVTITSNHGLVKRVDFKIKVKDLSDGS